LAVGSSVTVSGTVTSQAGRILGTRTIAIQDESGGLFVRLPSDGAAAAIDRGAIVQVTGVVATPYGNLELRPARERDVVVLGAGGLPDPVELDTSTIGEAAEGTLGTFIGTLVDINRYSSGALTLAVRDGHGDGVVYAHSEIGLDQAMFERGDRVRATGIVGQRATRSGAPDGYRLWLRGRADIEKLAGGPGTTPPPDSEPGEPPSGARPPRVRIKNATPGREVTIVGVVTSKAGVIDSEGRRVTVQDRTGAILVRYPAEAEPAAVGRVIRASGEVGTWYGALQLETTSKPRVKSRARIVPIKLQRAPDEADEWRLVSLRVTLADVERSGDTWRAEAEFASGAAVPIVGLAGSGIDSELLEPGRRATIIGIVRRAHPSASDQRFAVAPRSRKDIRLGRLVRDEDDEDDDDDSDADDDDQDEEGVFGAPGSNDGAVSATLGALSGLENHVVRVGGRLERIDGHQLTLDDGTARGSVRLGDGVGPFEPELSVGEVLNVTGRVRRRARGGREVVVRAAADLRRAVPITHLQSSITKPGTMAPVAAIGAIPTVGPGTVAPEAGQGSTIVRPLLMLLVLALLIVGTTLLGAAGLMVWRPHPKHIDGPQQPAAPQQSPAPQQPPAPTPSGLVGSNP
jgi:hypothetical protein